jgi:hypothetical protein
MRRILAAGVLVFVACGPPLPPPHPLGAPGSDPDDDRICKDEATTGTNMVRSVCLTREQVEENRRAAQDWEKRPHNDLGQVNKK